MQSVSFLCSNYLEVEMEKKSQFFIKNGEFLPLELLESRGKWEK